jgi:hypothetical protein
MSRVCRHDWHSAFPQMRTASTTIPVTSSTIGKVFALLLFLECESASSALMDFSRSREHPKIVRPLTPSGRHEKEVPSRRQRIFRSSAKPRMHLNQAPVSRNTAPAFFFQNQGLASNPGRDSVSDQNGADLNCLHLTSSPRNCWPSQTRVSAITTISAGKRIAPSAAHQHYFR